MQEEINLEEFFIKNDDEITVTLKINEGVNKVNFISKLMADLNKKDSVIDDACVTQIYFNGGDPQYQIEQFKKELIKQISEFSV